MKYVILRLMPQPQFITKVNSLETYINPSHVTPPGSFQNLNGHFLLRL